MKRTLAVTAMVLAACQTYDFEQVQPLAISQTTQSREVGKRKLKPNMMILVDRSGSMESPVIPVGPTCGTCGPSTSACPDSCATRKSELKSAMNTFLTSSGTVARMGVAFFPDTSGGNLCGATASTADGVDLPAPSGADDAASDMASQMNAIAINTKIAAMQVKGGTPTNPSLRFVGTVPGLNDNNDNRLDFVLLLTDGVPNCNPQNPNTCANASACQCTTSSCTMTFCTLGCLDRSGVVDAVKELRGKNIQTIVVGFGIGTSPGPDQANAPDILNAMAEAGGFARTCPNGTDAECGSGNKCLGTVCEKKFYQATNASELSAALANISAIIGGTDICEVNLEAQPDNSSYLAVILDGVNQPEGNDTWKYQNGKVVFQGATCDKLKAAISAKPINVQVRIVTTL